MTAIAPSLSITTDNGIPANLYVPPTRTDLTVAEAMRFLKFSSSTENVSIKDSGANIKKNLVALQTMVGRIDTVSSGVSTGAANVISVTDKEYLADKGILSKWKLSEGKFAFTDITAERAISLNTSISTSIDTFQVRDTALNIQNKFTQLNGFVSKLTSVTQLNLNTLVSITEAQFSAGTTLLTKLNKGSYNIAVTNVDVDNVISKVGALNLGANSKVKSISIVDDSDAIQNNIDELQRIGMKVKSIAQNTTDLILELDASKIRTNKSVLGKIVTGYQLAAENAASIELKSLVANNKVIEIDVVDTALNISRNWNNLNKIDTTVLKSVTVSNSDAVKINASQLAVSKDLIEKFEPAAGEPAFTLEIVEATASQVDDILSVEEVVSFNIRDTSENLSAYLSDLIDAQDTQKLTSIRTTNSSQIEMSWDMYSPADPDSYNSQDTANLLQKINKGVFNLKLTDVPINELTNLVSQKGIEAINILDSAENISENIDYLYSIGNKLKKIDIADPTLALDLSVNSFLNRQNVLNKINAGYQVNLENVTVKQALALSSNSHVRQLKIEDDSRNISANWDKLININNNLDEVVSTNIADFNISITADQFLRGMALDADPNDDLLTALQDKFSQASVKYAVKDASIAQTTELLSPDGTLRDLIANVVINENSENIGDNFALLKTWKDDDFLTKIIHVDQRNPIKIDYSELDDYSDLLGIIDGGGYRLAVNNVLAVDALALNADGASVNYYNIAEIHISDVSSAISENYDDLLTIGKKLSSIVLSDEDGNIDLTYAQYSKSSYVRDSIDSSYYLSLTDVPVYAASSVGSNAHVKTFTTKGTSDFISKAWDLLGHLQDKISSIINTTSASAIALSFEQWTSAIYNPFDLLDDGSTFSISNVKVSDLSDLTVDANVSDIKVADSSDLIDEDAALTALENSKITQITLNNSDDALVMSATDVMAKNAVLNKILNQDYLIDVTDATVTQTLGFVNEVASTPDFGNIKSIKVSDTSTPIQTNFAELKAVEKITSLDLGVNTLLTLNATTVLGSVDFIQKFDDYKLAITDISMSQLPSLIPADSANLENGTIALPILANIQDYYVKDTAANLSESFDNLIALDNDLKGFTIDGESKSLAISHEQWLASKANLNTAKGTQVYEFKLSNVLSGHLSDAAVNPTTDSLVKSISIDDATVNIEFNWSTLETFYGTGAGTVALDNLTFKDSDSLKLTAAKLIDSNLIDKVSLDKTLIVKDSAANISTNWDDLVLLFASGSGRLNGLELIGEAKVELTLAQQTDEPNTLLIAELPEDSVRTKAS